MSCVLIRKDVARGNRNQIKDMYKCECGNNFVAIRSNVHPEYTRSCGCRRGGIITHGMTKTSERNIWQGMKDRCFNKHNQAYERYGAKGITVSDDWLVFSNFYRDMGDRTSINHTLDRIDNEKSYSKDNCRWATKSEQAHNQRVKSKSGYKNVNKVGNQWIVRASDTRKSLGTYLCKHKAAMVEDMYRQTNGIFPYHKGSAYQLR